MRIIKKEIVIDAPPSVVWKHVTDPEKIAGWLMPNDFEPSVGRAFTLDCEVQGKIACIVREIVPHEKLVYTFHSSATRIETLVTITLKAEGASTRLTLIHSGWEKLPPADQGIADGFEQGWGEKLAKLREACTQRTSSLSRPSDSRTTHP
jgi:uncharacterized protein YndB with AHSA1/START domain